MQSRLMKKRAIAPSQIFCFTALHANRSYALAVARSGSLMARSRSSSKVLGWVRN